MGDATPMQGHVGKDQGGAEGVGNWGQDALLWFPWRGVKQGEQAETGWFE